ncbi:MAG: class I SAM-dependent methyltransferase [Clostridiales bacterium]|nr:class I SAM-dependent methyltransferase [Clostridiales bacterium]
MTIPSNKSFDAVAKTYDRFRPGYPIELFETIYDYEPIGAGSTVLEIGSGSGKATEPILSTGCSLTAVEPGINFCAILKDRFAAYHGFTVLQSTFEDADLPNQSYDLVFSATAFHWVPQTIGYQKVFSILKPGGAFARFHNRPYRCPDDPVLGDRIDRIYGRYYYPFYGKPAVKYRPFTKQQAEEIAAIAKGYGFSDIACHLFYRDRVFTAKEYIELLNTYSDHLALKDAVKLPFFAELEAAILEHGGSITLRDTIDLQLARKPY